MSGASSGAMTGAASGAAAGTAVMPGWGTLIGAGIGAIGGGLQGRGADQQAAARERALEALRQATRRYGSASTGLAEDTAAIGRTADLQEQGRFADVVSQYPSLAQIPSTAADLMNSYTGTAQGNMAPVPVGPTAGQNTANQGAWAAALRRASARVAPAAYTGAQGEQRVAEGRAGVTDATGMAASGRTVNDRRSLNALQQANLYEPYARAMAQFQLANGQASRAGSGSMLAGGLVNAGGGLLAGSMMG